MTDINNAPQDLNSTGDYPSKEQAGEKPFYDTTSAPMVSDINNNPPPYYNNPPPQYNPQQYNPAYQGQAPVYTPPANYNTNNYDINYTSNYNNGAQYPYQPTVPTTKGRFQNPRFQNPRLLLYIPLVLIVVFIIDLIIEIVFNSFNPYILGDCGATLIMAIIYLIFFCAGKSPKNTAIGAATIIVWFGGFCARGFGMTRFDYPVLIVIDFFLLIARSFAMFFAIPQTCG